MSRTLCGVFLLISALPPIKPTLAESHIGVGLGVLYNGIGINYSKSTENGLAFGAVGCIGISISGSSSTSDGATTRESESIETSCGVGIGFVSTELFQSKKHTIGASAGLNYNTGISGNSGLEWNVIPHYVYFLNGVKNRGINLGIGGVLTYRDSGFDDPGLLLNVGFHF